MGEGRYRPQTILYRRYRPQAKSISATCWYRPHHIVHRAHSVVFKYSRCVNRLAAHRRLIESQLDIQPTPQPTCAGCEPSSESAVAAASTQTAASCSRWSPSPFGTEDRSCHPSQSLLVRTVTSNTDQTAGGHKLVWNPCVLDVCYLHAHSVRTAIQDNLPKTKRVQFLAGTSI